MLLGRQVLRWQSAGLADSKRVPFSGYLPVPFPGIRIFLENLRKPRGKAGSGFWKDRMLEQNGESNPRMFGFQQPLYKLPICATMYWNQKAMGFWACHEVILVCLRWENPWLPVLKPSGDHW